MTAASVLAVMVWVGLVGMGNADAGKTEARMLAEQKVTLLASLIDRFEPDDAERSDVAVVGALKLRAAEVAAQAEAALEGGQYQKAGEQADEALKILMTLSNINLQGRMSSSIHKSRFRELLRGMEAIPEGLDSVETETVQNLVNTARAEAERNNFKLANEILSVAMGIKARTFAELHGPKTLVYPLAFDSPLDEYDYEVRRYNSTMLLIDLMRQDVDRGQAKEVIDGHLESASLLNKAAAISAKNGNLSTAIEKMEEASDRLSMALGYMGVDM